MEHQEYTINGEKVFSLVAEEDNYTSTRQDFSVRRPGLHPSSASVTYMDDERKIVVGKCMRQAYYSALRYPKDGQINVSLNMKANLGKWDEVGTVEKWKEMGIWRGNNIKFFNKDLALSGELDGILQNPVTGKLIGVEMKTFYGYPANRSICGVSRERGTGNRYNGRPKDEHFLQSVLYAWEYRETLDEYRLYYLERGDGHRIEFRIGWDRQDDGTHITWWQQVPGKYWTAFSEEKVYQPYTIEDIHARYKELLSLLRKKEVPQKDYEHILSEDEIEYRYAKGTVSKSKYDKWKGNPNNSNNWIKDWHCSYCDYKDTCEQEEA